MTEIISMRFLKDAPPYNAGEVAGFPLEKATKLEKARTAERWPPEETGGDQGQAGADTASSTSDATLPGAGDDTLGGTETDSINGADTMHGGGEAPAEGTGSTDSIEGSTSDATARPSVSARPRRS